MYNALRHARTALRQLLSYVLRWPLLHDSAHLDFLPFSCCLLKLGFFK